MVSMVIARTTPEGEVHQLVHPAGVGGLGRRLCQVFDAKTARLITTRDLSDDELETVRLRGKTDKQLILERAEDGTIHPASRHLSEDEVNLVSSKETAGQRVVFIIANKRLVGDFSRKASSGRGRIPIEIVPSMAPAFFLPW